MDDKYFGPKLPISEEIHAQKYRGDNESFSEAAARFAHTLADDSAHFRALYNILLDMRFLGGGRTQAAVGAPREVTAFNCFVSGTIEDSFDNIMKRATEAGQTMRLGGGIGYDFSTLRPRGDNITSLDSRSSGPISFMKIFDAICHTISSAGHRRGAQMGVLRVDHPDIEEFVRAKQNEDALRAFNISVGVTDKFMEAVKTDSDFDLVFDGRVYKTVRAKNLWEEIMRSTWEWAEPGVLFIDRINEQNNLHYCEEIRSTNPCQPAFATVLTPEGITTFDDIEVGSTIWSGEQWTKVTNKVHTGVKQVNEYVTTAGRFVGTENHQVIQNGERAEVKDAETIDITTGPDKDGEVVNPLDVVDGWVLGDGSVHKASSDLVYLCLGNNDDVFHDKLGDYVIADRRRSFKNGWEVKTTITADELPKTYDRRVPDRFKFGLPGKVIGFLRGLYAANGSVCGGRVTLKAASRQVINDVQDMLSSLGISSYVTTNKTKAIQFTNGEYQCRESYDLNICKDRFKFGHLIGFLHESKHQRLDATGPTSSRVKTSFEIIEENDLGKHPVFDITVEADEHTYWTGGLLVSNCAEQPLPPYGACLLGSFNLVKYLDKGEFDYTKLKQDIPHVVRAMDNIHDISSFPLQEQKEESTAKRRMGLGVTGVANAGEILGYEYASPKFLEWLATTLEVIRDEVYNASVSLAKEKGPFPLFDADKYLSGEFIKTLPQTTRRRIKKYGIRNSHLLSIAPTGTISLAADNVSSGIEPIFSTAYSRTVQTFDGPVVEQVEDFAFREYGVKGKTAMQCTAQEHLSVLATSQKYVDSSCSKTINIDPNTNWEDFKQVYLTAYETGCKGCTTFNPGGKRFGILNTTKEEPAAAACYLDPGTGKKTCE